MSFPATPGRLMRIVDRRADPPGRGTINRERFIRRFKDDIKRAADEEFARRSITDIGKGGRITIPGRGLNEPHLIHDDETGNREFVLPGNREFVPGDLIPRPENGRGQGSGDGDEPGSGQSRDSFAFVLSRDEFLALFFDDLELPNLERTRIGEVTLEKSRRAGYARDGLPSNLSPAQTVRMSIARRIALRGALAARIAELKREAEAETSETARLELLDEIERLTRRREALPFLEELDRRYRARAPSPAPTTRAVMLCLMDVSGSMDERKKDLAKRFFALLYLFLERKYGAVDVVFIRHTETAEEVDEKTFFYDTLSGGTEVKPALELARKIIAERYASDVWNVYIAQASDGDCSANDGMASAKYVTDELLPRVRYFAYVDIPGVSGVFRRSSDLWQTYSTITGSNFALRKVMTRQDIWPVFRELFARKEHHA